MSDDISDDPNVGTQQSSQANEPSTSYWHSSLFALGTNCGAVGLLGCLFPCYQLMLNRKSLTKSASITIGNCFTSIFCGLCCTFSSHQELATTYKLPFSFVVDLLKAWFCGPCTIWLDAHEIKTREESNQVPTYASEAQV